MPLLPRETVIDRPKLVDRAETEDNESEGDSQPVEELGDGSGPVINGIRFDQGDYGVVAASNLVAALSTAQTEGEVYEDAFVTSAIQMKEMVQAGIDISPIAQMSRSRGVDDLNVSQSDLQSLKLATETIDGDESDSDDETDDASELEDEDVKDGNEVEDEASEDNSDDELEDTEIKVEMDDNGEEAT